MITIKKMYILLVFAICISLNGCNETPDKIINIIQMGRQICTTDKNSSDIISVKIESKSTIYSLSRIDAWNTESYLLQQRKFINLLEFTNSIIRDNADAISYYYLGQLYEYLGDYDKAINAYENSIICSPQITFCYYRIYILYKHMLYNNDKSVLYFYKFKEQLNNNSDKKLKTLEKEILLEDINYLIDYYADNNNEELKKKYENIQTNVSADYIF